MCDARAHRDNVFAGDEHLAGSEHLSGFDIQQARGAQNDGSLAKSGAGEQQRGDEAEFGHEEMLPHSSRFGTPYRTVSLEKTILDCYQILTESAGTRRGLRCEGNHIVATSLAVGPAAFDHVTKQWTERHEMLQITRGEGIRLSSV